MKKVLAVVAVAALVVSSNRVSAADNMAYAAANAEVLTALTIEKTADLNFGKFAADPKGATAGTVIVPYTGARTVTGPLMPIAAAAGNPAGFTVSGDSTYTFTLTINSATVTLTDASEHTMTAGTFVSSCTTACTLSGGTLDVTVGGTLSVGAAQAKGEYTHAASAGGLQVTVAYN